MLKRPLRPYAGRLCFDVGHHDPKALVRHVHDLESLTVTVMLSGKCNGDLTKLAQSLHQHGKAFAARNPRLCQLRVFTHQYTQGNFCSETLSVRRKYFLGHPISKFVFTGQKK